MELTNSQEMAQRLETFIQANWFLFDDPSIEFGAAVLVMTGTHLTDCGCGQIHESLLVFSTPGVAKTHREGMLAAAAKAPIH
jgi:hypothetical protein